MKKNYSDLVNEAIQILENDDEFFVEMVNELDSRDGSPFYFCYKTVYLYK